MGKENVLETLELAASDQWGIITTAQAHREGVTRLELGRLADQGTIHRVRRGVYLLPSGHSGELMSIRASWIAMNPKLYPDERWDLEEQIVVSHESASTVHQIGDLLPVKYTLSAVGRKQTIHDDIRIYTNRDLKAEDVVNIDGLPVTSVERTISDLAANKLARNYLETIAVEGLQREGVRFSKVEAALEAWAGHYGADSGKELLQQFQKEATSVEDWQEVFDRFGSALALFSDEFPKKIAFSSADFEIPLVLEIKLDTLPIAELTEGLKALGQRDAFDQSSLINNLGPALEQFRTALSNSASLSIKGSRDGSSRKEKQSG